MTIIRIIGLTARSIKDRFRKRISRKARIKPIVESDSLLHFSADQPAANLRGPNVKCNAGRIHCCEAHVELVVISAAHVNYFASRKNGGGGGRNRGKRKSKDTVNDECLRHVHFRDRIDCNTIRSNSHIITRFSSIQTISINKRLHISYLRTCTDFGESFPRMKGIQW